MDHMINGKWLKIKQETKEKIIRIKSKNKINFLKILIIKEKI